MSMYNNVRIYDVFVSATVMDLKEHRLAAFDAITKLGHRPVGMEGFGARSEEAKAFIYQCIKESDFFVLILGRNAGSIIDGKPYVSLEYEHAVSLKKPILAFLINDNDIRATELKEAADLFRKHIIGSGGLVGWYNFNNIDEFKSIIGQAVYNESKRMEAGNRGGWIRNELLDSFVSRNNIPTQIINSAALKTTLNPLFEMDGLISNLDKYNYEKESACDHVIHRVSVSLSSPKGINRIFIDGGSTTHVFCRRINEFFNRDAPFLHQIRRKKLVIGTNSLFNFIELSIGAVKGKRTFRSLRLYPSPPVDKHFGKSFGDLENVASESEYSYEKSSWNLTENARNHVDAAVLEFQSWLDHDSGKSLIIMSAAAFMTKGERDGPWVKDHSSMLQQQSIFAARRPIVLIIDPAKWDKKLGKHDGYPVLFDHITWKNVVKESPIAISVTTSAPELAAEMEMYFRSLFMQVVHEVRDSPSGVGSLYSLMAFTPSFEPLIVRDGF